MFKKKSKISLLLILLISNIYANEDSLYLLGNSKCEALSKYGFSDGMEGFKEFVDQEECTLVDSNQQTGVFALKCTKLDNKTFIFHINYNNCLNMLKQR